MGVSVEFAGYMTNQVARDRTFTYAGIMLSQFEGDPDRLREALAAACGVSQGVMVFDLSHNIDPFWAVFKQAFGRPAKAPTQVPGLLERVRKLRAAEDRAGVKRDPVVVMPGMAGAGH